MLLALGSRNAQHSREVNTVSILFRHKQISASHKLVHSAYAQLCHILAELLCDEVHEVHDIFGLASETLSELGVLCSDTHGTGIKIAHSHHYTAHCNKRSSCESELLSAQQCRNKYITTCHELSVGLYAYPRTQTVEHKGLVSFSKSQLPWKTCIIYGASGSSACTAVIARDEYYLSACLGNTCRNSSHASLGDKLYGDTRLIIGIFQVKDELCQIFNGVDIVMRRR